MRTIIDGAYARAKAILTQHRDKLVALAEALLEYETLDAAEIREIVETGKLLKPPTRGPGLSSSAAVPPPQPEAAADSKKPEIYPTPGIGTTPASA